MRPLATRLPPLRNRLLRPLSAKMRPLATKPIKRAETAMTRQVMTPSVHVHVSPPPPLPPPPPGMRALNVGIENRL